jgi:hypothetical protein
MNELWGDGGVVSRKGIGGAGRKRGVPDDFSVIAQELNVNIARLQSHYNAAQTTVYAWLKEVGLRSRRHRVDSPPANLHSMAKAMTTRALAEHYGVSTKMILSWARAIGVKPKVPRQVSTRPVPLDFTDNASRETIWGLRKIYGCGEKTIERWLAETGVKAQIYIPVPPVNTRRPKLQKQQNGKISVSRMGSAERVFHGKKLSSDHDVAADTLRRERWIVYRCDDRGRAAENGKFWRCGNLVLTPDELLAKAARYERQAA